MATGFKVKRRIVAMGGGDFSGGKLTLQSPNRVILPSGTAIGTTFPASSGEICVTQRAAGSPCIVARLNGTNYYTTLTAL
jgi:hypothetical protein